MSSLKYDEAVVVANFKMKFESLHYREKTTDFYGKKGLSWHGCIVYSRYREEQRQENEKLLDYNWKINMIYNI